MRDLVDTVELPGRAGVAAPQIGVGLRAFSYNIDGDIGYVLNPVLVEVSGEPELVGEGCLSVPGLWHDALRHPYARRSPASTSTATRSCSRARVCSRRRCSTRPTTSTASSTSSGSQPRRDAIAMREIRETRLVLTRIERTAPTTKPRGCRGAVRRRADAQCTIEWPLV